MKTETMRNVLGGFIAGSFASSLAALYLLPIPAANKDLIVFMLGQLSGFMGAVMAFHFGTSKGSVDKTQLLAGSRPDDAATTFNLPSPQFGDRP